jgi:hypothetical protein
MWPNRLCRTQLEIPEAQRGRFIDVFLRSGIRADVNNAMAAKNMESR